MNIIFCGNTLHHKYYRYILYWSQNIPVYKETKRRSPKHIPRSMRLWMGETYFHNRPLRLFKCDDFSSWASFFLGLFILLRKREEYGGNVTDPFSFFFLSRETFPQEIKLERRCDVTSMIPYSCFPSKWPFLINIFNEIQSLGMSIQKLREVNRPSQDAEFPLICAADGV